MSAETLLLFAGAMFTLAIIPGPGVLLTVSRTLSGGLSHALVTIVGIVMGDLIFLLLAIYGLNAIAESLGFLFTIIKYAGGAYLIWLGISLWRSTGRNLQILETPAEPSNNQPVTSYFADFAAGLIITLSNPKVIVFYLSFLPAFVDITTLSAVDVVLIATVVSVVLAGVMIFYALSTIKTHRLVANKRSQSVTQKIAGSLMVAAGGVLIIKT